MNYHTNAAAVNRSLILEIADYYAMCMMYFEKAKIMKVDMENLRNKRRKIDYIEDVLHNALDEMDYFIISNEVIKGKRGTWYLGYLSTSTYYRHRAKAYANFLSCLDQ